MQKRLLRSKTDQQVAGVAAGLANYFNIDPTIVRLLFVLGTFMGGPGLIIYIALWMVMPEDKGETVVEIEKSKNEEMV